MKKSAFWFLACILLYAFLYAFLAKEDNTAEISQKIQTVCRIQSAALQQETKQLLDLYQKQQFDAADLNPFEVFSHELQSANRLSFIFTEDSLIFWNNNRINPQKVLDTQADTNTILLKIDQSWYLYSQASVKSSKIIVLEPVYLEYPIQNDYLYSGFNAELFPFAKYYKIKEQDTDAQLLKHRNDPAYFTIERTKADENGKDSLRDLMLFLLFLICLSLLYDLLLKAYKHLIHSASFSPKLLHLHILDVLIIQLLIRWLGHLWLPLDSTLFSPGLFSSSYIFPSLGYLIIHLHAFLYIALYFVRVKAVFKQRNSVLSTYVFLFSSVLLTLLSIAFSVISVEHLLTNSNVSTSFSEFYTQNIWSVILFITAVLLHASFLIFAFGFYQYTNALKRPLWEVILAFLVSLFFVLLGISQFSSLIFGHSLFLILYFGLFTAYMRFAENSGEFRSYLLYALLFSSIMLTFVLYGINESKSEQELQLTAHKLSQESDPLFEYLFKDALDKMQEDNDLHLVVKELTIQEEDQSVEIYSYINANYFTDYFANYTIEQTLCFEGQTLNIQPDDYTISCNLFFNNMIAESGKEILPERLYLLEDNIAGFYYLATIPLSLFGSSDSISSLYIEFYFKYIPEGLGYPDLLVDKSKVFTRDFANYSFADYHKGILVYKFGSFLYPNSMEQIECELNTVSRQDGYKHLLYKVNAQKSIIVSKKSKGLFNIIAPFSYFFILLALITLCIILIYNKKRINISLRNFSFRLKLQMILILSLFFSFGIIGFSSTYFIANIYKSKNKDFLVEKTQSVLIEMEQQLRYEDISDGDMQEYLDRLLLKYSYVFFSDINLFDLNAHLLASSRPEIFEFKLLSTQMNPVAFNEMHHKGKLMFLQEESIGKSNFMSAYIPLKDASAETIAYINLPFFAREAEVRSEITSLLLTYTNIFLLLAAMAIALALFFSRRLTQPLQMIQEKMQMVRIDQLNEKIRWNSRDELGQLVDQYNNLLDQLQESAELLAKSERESAWREMAKQVAHEIKNPLTPMRLSIQYLERAWNENDPDIDTKIRSTTQTVINQIDSLSAIATAFSDFAKMPISKPKPYQIKDLINEAISLFDNQENIRFVMQDLSTKPAWVRIDKDNFNRALTNLIKNSVQAIGQKLDGLIEILLEEENNYCIISVKDNGKGMTAEEAAKVFTPNFTTKSSGMGLGLSMVKNIIDSADGSISFSSEEGKGTIFVISLPLINE